MLAKVVVMVMLLEQVMGASIIPVLKNTVKFKLIGEFILLQTENSNMLTLHGQFRKPIIKKSHFAILETSVLAGVALVSEDMSPLDISFSVTFDQLILQYGNEIKTVEVDFRSQTFGRIFVTLKEAYLLELQIAEGLTMYLDFRRPLLELEVAIRADLVHEMTGILNLPRMHPELLPTLLNSRRVNTEKSRLFMDKSISIEEQKRQSSLMPDFSSKLTHRLPEWFGSDHERLDYVGRLCEEAAFIALPTCIYQHRGMDPKKAARESL
ncbi:hypothetical protein Ciccas_013165 [Cichlidogyrus casuarinus]|uniref:Secreted protein n=1 Tax=Cichlidogyrus casuarinus TaxID=1844966 RepID=A0ABD2PMD1_9PLAT